MKEETCHNCKFSKLLPWHALRCHRYPPQPVKVLGSFGGLIEWQFPETSEPCGEWKEKEP